MTQTDRGFRRPCSDEAPVHASARLRLAPDEPADDSEDVLDESIQLPLVQLPLDVGVPLPLEERDIEEHDPEYGDLIDSGWVDRAAYVEELDDDRSNSLEVGLTLDLNDSGPDDEVGQMMDLDVGALLTPLPKEGETDRDAARDSLDPSFAAGALHELLLPDESDAEIEDAESIDDERFPAFDDAPVPTSGRVGDDDGSDSEGFADEDA